MLRQEFASNQLALGYDERIACGRSSRFRMEAFRMTAAPSESVDRIVKEVLNWTAENTSEDEISMLTETRLYLAGDHKAAIRKLNVLDAEALYAKALMMLESGQVTECDVALRQFVDEFSDHRLAGSARMILTSLAF
jgi:hypothetical protein